jgi:serine/threonine protein phosphatase PrpC
MFDWLRSLFRRPVDVESQAEPDQSASGTAPLTPSQIEAITHSTARLDPDQLMFFSARSVGREREHNEDSLFTFSALLASENKTFSMGIFIVADGLGGHEAGDIASEAAARSMASHLMQAYYSRIFGLDPEAPASSVQEILEAGVAEAHKAVQMRASGGGTTLTAGMLLGSRLSIAHVGDSRAYLIQPDGELELLTRDHSFAQRLVELGEITPEEAETHPKRHDLYRALGLEVSAVPDVYTAALPKEGGLLLCSDGLWGVIPENELVHLIQSAASLQDACGRLVDAANAAGGPDNISVILVKFSNS